MNLNQFQMKSKKVTISLLKVTCCYLFVTLLVTYNLKSNKELGIKTIGGNRDLGLYIRMERKIYKRYLPFGIYQAPLVDLYNRIERLARFLKLPNKVFIYK